MKAGAVELLAKPFRDQDLIDAIQAAIARDRARRADARVLVELRRRFAALTPREQDVMRQVVSGRLNKQVAGDLNLSETRVKALRGQIMRKMQGETLPELVRMADRLGITAANQALTTKVETLPPQAQRRARQYESIARCRGAVSCRDQVPPSVARVRAVASY